MTHQPQRAPWAALALLLAGAAAQAQDQRIQVLEAEISAVESKGNVDARSSINKYWELADLYLTGGDKVSAARILARGLQLDAWNLPYQKLLADLELERGDLERARYRLQFIVRNLEDERAVYDQSVAALAGVTGRLGAGGAPARPTLPGHVLYLAAYPQVNDGLLGFVSARISQEYGIQVRTVRVGDSEAAEGMRDNQQAAYDQIIADVQGRYAAEVVDGFLSRIPLTRADLGTPEGKRKFVFALLSQDEAGKTKWNELERVARQYDADVLLGQVRDRTGKYIREAGSLGVLAITAQDIYASDYNFLFGWAQERVGVMSYARFTLDNPSSTLRDKRVSMQALSSAGFVIGIPRCTQPDCARAYPHSLAEQDRKTDTLCAECLANLAAVYRAAATQP